MTNLFFIEKKDDIAALKENKADKFYKIISLDPEVSYFLEKNGISFNNQDDYFKRGEYIDLASENFKKTEEFCNYCDEFLQKKIDFLKNNKLAVTFYHFLCFRVLFDILKSRFYIIKNIIEKEKPELICYFDNYCEDEINERFYFAKNSPYNEALKIIADYYSIKCAVYNSKDVKGSATYNPITDVSNSTNLIRRVYRSLRKIYDSFLNKYEKLPVIFMTSPSYDLSRVAKLIKNTKLAKILSFSPESSADPYFIFPTWEKVRDISYDKIFLKEINLKEIWCNIKRDEKFQNFFMEKGINLFPAAEKRLEYFFVKFIIEIMDLYLKGLELFKKYKPKIFLAPYVDRARMKILAEAARTNNIPIAVYQHGGVYGYTKYMLNGDSDVEYCDYFISFGEGLKSRFGKCKAQNMPVGSFILSELTEKNTGANKVKLIKKLKLKKDKKIVVFVMSSLLRSISYIDHLFYTDHECFNVQKKIIDVFAKHDDYQYILKVFPLYKENDPIVSYAKDKNKENFKIIWDIPFKQLIPCADLFVMDSASTPLLEALTINKKIMVYNLFGSMYPDAVEVLKKRAYYSENIDEYLSELDKELAKGDFEIKNPNNEFSELYGKYDDLDEIKNRTMNFLQDILK